MAVFQLFKFSKHKMTDQNKIQNYSEVKWLFFSKNNKETMVVLYEVKMLSKAIWETKMAVLHAHLKCLKM